MYIHGHPTGIVHMCVRTCSMRTTASVSPEHTSINGNIAATSSTQLCSLRHSYQAKNTNICQRHGTVMYLIDTNWIPVIGDADMCASIAKFDTIRRHSSSMWACQCSKRVSSIISPLCTWRCIAMLRLLPILLMFSSIQVSKT